MAARLIVTALTLVLFAGATRAETPLVVMGDWGGRVDARAERIASLGDRPVRIEGLCYSACTMYLALPDVCATPDAVFGFHGPSVYGLPLLPRDFEYWSRVIAAYYPPSLAEWYLRKGRFGTFSLRGEGMIANDWVRECP